MKQSVLSIVLILLLSCHKNNDVVFEFSGIYRTDLNSSVEPLILLTDNKTITDTAIILNFLERKNLNSAFVLDKTSVEISADLLTVNFQDTVISYIVNDSIRKSAISKKLPSIIVISDIDSIKTYVPIDDNRCNLLSDSIKEINPVNVFYSFPLATGILGYNKFTPTYPLIVNHQQLSLPLITYVTSFSSSTQYCYSLYKDVWNKFNSNLLHQLKPGDTVVYQIKQVPLIKQ